jgi:hypothetical protein
LTRIVQLRKNRAHEEGELRKRNGELREELEKVKEKNERLHGMMARVRENWDVEEKAEREVDEILS